MALGHTVDAFDDIWFIEQYVEGTALEGTGPGLSLVKEYIEMHNGSIRVESEVGRGSSFIFELPLKPAQ